MKHYVKVDGGDEVLIDLGGYGILTRLDSNNRWYLIDYVGIEYDGPEGQVARPDHIPADMKIMKGGMPTMVEQADTVKIWRHGVGEPSSRGDY